MPQSPANFAPKDGAMKIEDVQKLKADQRKELANQMRNQALADEARADAVQKQIDELTAQHKKLCERAHQIRSMARAVESLPEHVAS